MTPQARLGLALTASAIALSMSGCAPTSGSSGCSEFAVIHPDVGFETRWTAAEKRAVLANNDVWRAVCK